MSVLDQLTALPSSGLTISALDALDKLVPGDWSNVRALDALTRDVTGIDHPGLTAAVIQRARAIEASSPRYGQALQAFTIVDTVDQLAAGAAVASKVGSMFSQLGFLKDFTPKPETTQAMDAGLKLVSELVAFGLLQGVSTDGPQGLARFAGALEDYARFDRMRLAGWVVYDGLLPLGPNFVGLLLDTFKSAADSALASNAVFEQLADKLPGDSVPEKKAFVIGAIDSAGDWVTRFVSDQGLTRDKVLAQLDGVLGVADGGLDYVAAAIDASTAYFSHTGTQTVARVLVQHAVEGLRDDAWEQWLTTLPR